MTLEVLDEFAVILPVSTAVTELLVFFGPLQFPPPPLSIFNV